MKAKNKFKNENYQFGPLETRSEKPGKNFGANLEKNNILSVSFKIVKFFIEFEELLEK